MILAHKIQLDPNNIQQTYFAKCCGVARFAYNWALAEWNRLYKLGEKVSEGELRKRLNAIKRELYPWMLEVTKCAPQLAIMNLGTAFKNFFAGTAKNPTFKKKGYHDSFEISNDQFKVKEHSIRIPNLGWVRMTETLRFEGKILGAAVSRTADKWFVSIAQDVQVPRSAGCARAAIQVEMSAHKPVYNGKNQAVGVDLGVKNLATLSDGTTVEGPKPHTALLKRLRRLSRSLSRKKKGSRNFTKAKRKLARLHARISNIRKDALHKLTTELTQKYSHIGIENLNVSGMTKNHRLARSINDMGFYEFRRQLEYKAKITGSVLVVADSFYPSSKTCSECGFKLDELPLNIRLWTCPACYAEHNRDINAAKNLKNMAVSSTVPACGEMVQQDRSAKQELNFKPTYGQV